MPLPNEKFIGSNQGYGGLHSKNEHNLPTNLISFSLLVPITNPQNCHDSLRSLAGSKSELQPSTVYQEKSN